MRGRVACESNRADVHFAVAGGGKGSWSAWKAGEMARRYEERGGDYEDEAGSKNKAKKGPPEKKEGGK